MIKAQKTIFEPDEEGPVNNFYRFMANRKERLFYNDDLEKKLPIGSDEIKNTHRYIVQHRFKLAGAWWKSENIGNYGSVNRQHKIGAAQAQLS